MNFGEIKKGVKQFKVLLEFIQSHKIIIEL